MNSRGKHIAILAVVCLLTSAYFLAQEFREGVSQWGFPLDDPWIHLVIARNLANGHGLVFNPGEAISCSTSPLWTIMFAPIFWLNLNFVAFPKLLGVAFFLGSVFLAYSIADRLFNNKNIALAAGLFTVLGTNLPWAGLSGMETCLYTFLSLLGVYWHLRYRTVSDWRQYLAVAVFALTVPARPETLTLIVFAVVDRFFVPQWRQEKRLLIRPPLLPIIKHIAVYLLILSPYFGANLYFNGQPFPVTFSAKVSDGLFQMLLAGNIMGMLKALIWLPLKNLAAFLFYCFSNNPVIVLAALFGIVIYFRRGPESAFLLIAIIGQPLIKGMVAPYRIMIDHGRYMQNIQAFLVILGAWGLFEAARYLAERPDLRRKLRIAGWPLGAVAALAAVFILIAINPFSGSLNDPGKVKQALMAYVFLFLVIFCLAAFCHSIFFARRNLSSSSYSKALVILALVIGISYQWMVSEMYMLEVRKVGCLHAGAGKWINKNIPQGSMIALNDIGAVTFFAGDVRVIDINGLVTPEIVPYRRDMSDPEKFNNAIWPYLEKRRPDYIVALANWTFVIPDMERFTEKIYESENECTSFYSGKKTFIYKTIWSED